MIDNGMRKFQDFCEGRMSDMIQSNSHKTISNLESLCNLYIGLLETNPEAAELFKQSMKGVLDSVSAGFGWNISGLYRYIK